jgi:hypothetical protein
MDSTVVVQTAEEVLAGWDTAVVVEKSADAVVSVCPLGPTPSLPLAGRKDHVLLTTCTAYVPHPTSIILEAAIMFCEFPA